MDQVSPLADALLVAEHEVQLAIEDERELLLVGLHVERWAFLVRLGHDSRLHEFTNRGLHELLRVGRARVLLHLGNPIKRHFLLPPFTSWFESPITPRRTECPGVSWQPLNVSRIYYSF